MTGVFKFGLSLKIISPHIIKCLYYERPRTMLVMLTDTDSMCLTVCKPGAILDSAHPQRSHVNREGASI